MELRLAVIFSFLLMQASCSTYLQNKADHANKITWVFPEFVCSDASISLYCERQRGGRLGGL